MIKSVKSFAFLAIKKRMDIFYDREKFTCTPCTVLAINEEILLLKTVCLTDYVTLFWSYNRKKKRNVHNAQRSLYKQLSHAYKNQFIFKIKNIISVEKKNILGRELYDFIKQFIRLNDRLKITSNRKSKGFCGVMKKHGFAGGTASHGNSLAHRKGGAIGCHGLGRIIPYTKMPGKISNFSTTFYNKQVIFFNDKMHEIWIKGSVSGHNNSVIKLFKIHE